MHCQTKAPLQLSWKVIGEIQKKKIQKRKTKIFLTQHKNCGTKIMVTNSRLCSTVPGLQPPISWGWKWVTVRPSAEVEHVNPCARCLVNLTYVTAGRLRRHERSERGSASGRGAIEGALGLSLSVVATRLWICPGHILCRRTERTELNQSEPNWTELSWAVPPPLSLPHGILQFLWDFEIAFSTFRSPVQEATFQPPPQLAQRPTAIANPPAQNLSFSAISPLWGCGKDSDPLPVPRCSGCSVIVGLRFFWGQPHGLRASERKSAEEKIDQEKWLLWVFVIFIARVIENFQIPACIFRRSLAISAPPLRHHSLSGWNGIYVMIKENIASPPSHHHSSPPRLMAYSSIWFCSLPLRKLPDRRYFHYAFIICRNCVNLWAHKFPSLWWKILHSASEQRWQIDGNLVGNRRAAEGLYDYWIGQHS